MTANLFTNNTVTQWGGGLYVSAWTEGEIGQRDNELECVSQQSGRECRRRLLL